MYREMQYDPVACTIQAKNAKTEVSIMNIVNKTKDTISSTVDILKEKNKKSAYLNRLKAIITGEQETIECAYLALGKLYLDMLEGNAEQRSEAEKFADIIKASKLRLKKARARYEYTLKYGVPKPGTDAEEVIQKENDAIEEAKKAEEEQDITIAYADPDAKD